MFDSLNLQVYLLVEINLEIIKPRGKIVGQNFEKFKGNLSFEHSIYQNISVLVGVYQCDQVQPELKYSVK